MLFEGDVTYVVLFEGEVADSFLQPIDSWKEYRVLMSRDYTWKLYTFLRKK